MEALAKYQDLIPADEQEHRVVLNREEACTILKAHDYGVGQLSEDERYQLDRVIGKLKDSIWP